MRDPYAFRCLRSYYHYTERRSKEVAIRKVHGGKRGADYVAFCPYLHRDRWGDGFVGFSAALWIYGVLGTDVSHFFPLRSLVLGNCVSVCGCGHSLYGCVSHCAQLPALIRQKTPMARASNPACPTPPGRRGTPLRRHTPAYLACPGESRTG